MEAIIRIAESVAKIRLSPIATVEDVDEAIRLFKFSTLNAVQCGLGDMSEDVDRIQDIIKKRLPLGWTTTELTLKQELRAMEFADTAIEGAIHFLVQKNVLMHKERRQLLTRIAY